MIMHEVSFLGELVLPMNMSCGYLSIMHFEGIMIVLFKIVHIY